jgi:hypothetical protein
MKVYTTDVSSNCAVRNGSLTCRLARRNLDQSPVRTPMKTSLFFSRLGIRYLAGNMPPVRDGGEDHPAPRLPRGASLDFDLS